METGTLQSGAVPFLSNRSLPPERRAPGTPLLMGTEWSQSAVTTRGRVTSGGPVCELDAGPTSCVRGGLGRKRRRGPKERGGELEVPGGFGHSPLRAASPGLPVA
uniref:Uncharacterized protein n=1 Tax=Sphaerodactylus townsendi TaxID=933632 RepID=A0ACB8ECA8_9SAUR